MTRRLTDQFTSTDATRPLPIERLAGLTNRERTTLRMLAEARSNPEIAAAMMATHTTEAHVGSVPTKLGLRDRVRAVITTYETGPVGSGQR